MTAFFNPSVSGLQEKNILFGVAIKFIFLSDFCLMFKKKQNKNWNRNFLLDMLVLDFILSDHGLIWNILLIEILVKRF